VGMFLYWSFLADMVSDAFYALQTKCPESPKRASWFAETVAIALFAVGYFADFLIIGLWIGARWCAAELNAEFELDALDSGYMRLRASLIALVCFKTAAAVVGHAWAVVLRKCSVTR